MSYPHKQFYEFGNFRLNVSDRLLLREEEVVRLMPKTVETLLILIQRRGEVVTKEELVQALWPDVVVEENNLSQHVSALRRALGQDENNRYIETVPRRGYRFVAELRESVEPEAAVITPIQVEFVALNHDVPPASVNEAKLHRRRWWLWAGIGLLGLIGALLLFTGRLGWRPAPSEIAEVKSIAVLPFKFLQSQTDEEKLGLGVGIADNLINRLGRLSQLVIRPVRAVNRYADAPLDALVAGQELRVDAVLDGSLQRAQERLRVSVQLLRVRDGKTLWADQFDGQLSDIFAIQDWIADRVTKALALELTKQQREQLARRYTANVAAWQAYVKGRYFWNQRTVPALRKASEHFEQAIKEDQRYALAHSGLADTWVLLGVFGGVPPQEAAAKAQVAVRQALELDEEIAEAHASLAVLKAWFEWDWAGAEREYRRALALNPSYATAHQWYGLMLANLGRGPEAITELRRAQELDPLSLIITADLGLVHAFAGQYEQAVKLFRQTLELDANFSYARLELGRVYVQQERYEEALGEFARLMEREGRTLNPLVDVGYTRAVMGQPAEARKILAEMLARARTEFVPPMMLACVYGALGEKEQAFQMLEQEFAQHSDRMTNLRTNYMLTPLRSDPRFSALLRRVGLATQ